jgi:hypothetical protein
MIRPMDGNTVLFFTEADVVAMAKDNRIPGRGLFEAAGYKYGIYDSIPSGLGI